MTEDEYNQSDSEFDDEGEFGDSFLSSEESDDEITMIMIPKLDFNLDLMLKGYLKNLKSCQTTEKAMEILYDLYSQIQIITTVENGIEELQFKAENFESLMKTIKFV